MGKRGSKQTKGLTPKEKQVGSYILKGLTTNEIAEQLRCTQSAVKYHITGMNKKFKCKTRAHLVQELSKVLPKVNKKNVARKRYGDKHYVWRPKRNYICDPHTNRTVRLSELIGRDDYTVTNSQGKDVTDFIIEKVAAHADLLARRAIKKQQAAKAFEKVQATESGFYCDCKPSTDFKNPEDMPEEYIMELEKPSKFTKVQPDKEGCCQFCGHYLRYFDVAPTQGANKNLTPNNGSYRLDIGGRYGIHLRGSVSFD